MDHIIALVPSAGVLLLFVFVVRYFLRADRIEREEMRELDRESAEPTNSADSRG